MGSSQSFFTFPLFMTEATVHHSRGARMCSSQVMIHRDARLPLHTRLLTIVLLHRPNGQKVRCVRAGSLEFHTCGNE